MQTSCVICFEQSTKLSHTLPCDHTFHADCIIDWFRRSSTCPLCRAGGVDAYKVPRSYAERYEQIVSYVRQHNAPRRISDMVKRIQRHRVSEAKVRRALETFKETNKSIFKSRDRLERDCHEIRRTLQNAIVSVGAYVHPELPIPLVDIRLDSD